MGERVLRRALVIVWVASLSCAPAAAPVAAPVSPAPELATATALGPLRAVSPSPSAFAPLTASPSRPAPSFTGGVVSSAPATPAAVAPTAAPAAASLCALPSTVSVQAEAGEYAGPIFDDHLHLFVDRRLVPTNAGSEGLCRFVDRLGFIAVLGLYGLPAASPPRSNALVNQNALLIESARTRVIPSLEMGQDAFDLFTSTTSFAKGLYTDAVLQGYLAPQWVFQSIGEVPENVWLAPGIDSQPMQVVLRNVNAQHAILMIHAYEQTDVATQRAKIDAVVKGAPNVTFLFHGSKRAFDFIEPLLSKYPNVYFSWDGGPGWMVGSWGSLMHPGAGETNPLGTGGSTDQFLADVQRVGIDNVVNENFSWFLPRLQKYPDRITAAMDFNASWHFDDASSSLIVKIFRRIVAKLPADLQERYAYRNAMRILGPYLAH